MKIKATIEYDGTQFSGWQFQSDDVQTVQGEFERALDILYKSYSKQREESYKFLLLGSGRTDRDVHAKAQVATFNWPENLEIDLGRFRHEINGITPRAVSIVDLEFVPNSFCAKSTPHIKRYCYTITNTKSAPVLAANTSWWISKKLDVKAMLDAIECIRGQHDFTSFRSKDCNAKTTLRTLNKVELELRDAKTIVITFEGGGFLKNMIRIIIGTLVEIGKGNLPASEMRKILEARDRSFAGITAPGQGLCLEFVNYERPISSCC